MHVPLVVHSAQNPFGSRVWLCNWLYQELQIPNYNEHVVETCDQDHERRLADIVANAVHKWGRDTEPLFNLHFQICEQFNKILSQ